MTEDSPNRETPGTPDGPNAPAGGPPGPAPASPNPSSGPAPAGHPAPGPAPVPGPPPARPPADAGPAGRSGTPIPRTAYAGGYREGYNPPPKRTSAQIRADIEAQRAELGQSVDHLRDKVTELTDWRSQVRKHRKKIVVGAVATGFVVGGLMALRRR